MKLEEIIYYKYRNIDKYYFIAKHISSFLFFKYFKIVYPFWIDNRLKELEKLYTFHKYKRCLEDVQIRDRKAKKEEERKNEKREN